jgi:hypothetical protein
VAPAAKRPAPKRRKKSMLVPALVLLLLTIAAVGGVAAFLLFTPKSLELAPLPAKVAPEMAWLDMTIKPVAKGLSNHKLVFSLEGAPKGATIDANSGRLTWNPTEAQGPGVYNMKVRVTVDGLPTLVAEQPLAVTVTEENQAPKLAAIPNADVVVGEPFEVTVTATDGDTPKQTITYGLMQNAPPGSNIDPTTGRFTWVSKTAKAGANLPVTIVATDSEGEKGYVTFYLRTPKELGPGEQVVAWLKSENPSAKDAGKDNPPLFGNSKAWAVAIGNEKVSVYEFPKIDSADLAISHVLRVSPDHAQGYRLFQKDQIIVATKSKDAELLDKLHQRYGEGFAVSE